MVLLNMLWTLGLARRVRSAHPVMDSLKIGQRAPAFSAPTLQGKTIALTDYVDRAIAFVFVSPHCEPCREELPHLRDLSAKARDYGVELVLVSDEGEETTRPFADGKVDTLTVLVAPRNHNRFFSDYKVPGTPSFCLLDAQGKVKATGIGVPELAEKIEALPRVTKGGD